MDIAVIGLGRFGRTCAIELMENGANVLGIDISEELVNDVKDKLTKTYIMDSTNKQNLIEIGIEDMDFVVVAIGENEHSSIFTTLLLKQLGVSRIITRSTSEEHSEILRLIGVEEIIMPEVQSAKRTAQKLIGGNINNYFDLSDEQTIAELPATEVIAGQSIQKLDIRKNFNISIIGIRQQVPKVGEKGENKYEEKITHIVHPDYTIKLNDRLVIVGHKKDVNNFIKYTKEGK
ncbi:MAG: potassium channel family protein [Spirochaetota bacterium]